MDRWVNRVAVVTGATTGIGASFAVGLAQKGMKVVGCGRRVEKFDELNSNHGVKIYGYKCDLRNESEIRGMFDWIKNHKELGQWDLCICNAGLSGKEGLLEGKSEDWKDVMNVNLFSTCLITQLSIKQFHEANIDDGHIVYTNSIVSHKIPNKKLKSLHFYTGTKMANISLLEMWRREIQELEPKRNIRISSISPGLVESDFLPSMLKDDPNKERILESLKSSWNFLTPQDILDTLIYIISSPIHVQIHDIVIQPKNCLL